MRQAGLNERVKAFLQRVALLGSVFAVLGCGSNNSDTEQRCISIPAEEQTVFLRDVKIDPYRFFDIGWFSGESHVASGDKIIQFRLYEGQSVAGSDPSLPYGYAFPDILNSTASPDSVRYLWKELDPLTEYTLDPDRHFIFLSRRLVNIHLAVVAYWIVVLRADGGVDTLGDVSHSSYRLQMLKRARPQPDDGLWDASWRNVYDLPVRGDFAAFDVDIFRGAFGDEGNPANPNNQSGMPFLQLLGLDSVGRHGESSPDGNVDFERLVLFPDEVLLIFPDRHPFASPVLVHPYPEMYSELDGNVLLQNSKYYFRVRYRQRPAIFSLGDYQIVKGSVVVTLGGQMLSEGAQYEILCPGLQIRLLDDLALDPNLFLDVCFEYVP